MKDARDLSIEEAGIRVHNLCLIGFGNVGRALVALLRRKEQELLEQYDISWRITGVGSRRLGWLVAPEGFSPGKLLADDFSGAYKAKDVRGWLRQCQADVLFEASSLNAVTGEPAIEHIQSALAMGAHAISANKGSVVHAYEELSEMARAQDKRFLFEATVMDGVPIFSLFREVLPMVSVRGFRAVLNSTTNVVLEAMEAGMTLEASIQEAQRLGVAESNPADDLDGVDSAVKVLALANVLMKAALKLDDIKRQGIRELTTAKLQEARLAGEAWKLVCAASRNQGGHVEASVAPERLQASDPLAQVRGTSSVIAFKTDIFPELILFEQNPGLEATAYGLLADFISAVRSS